MPANQFLPTVTQLLTAVAAWLILFPVSLLIPRDRRRIVVIGRDKGNFSDNAKYFFEYARRQAAAANIRVEFLTEDRRLRDALRRLGAACILYPSLSGLWSLLRAGIIVMDSAEWIYKGRFQATIGAVRVQLWHGIPLKQIELPLFRRRLMRLRPLARFLLAFQKQLSGRYARADVMASTSAFVTEHAFAEAFRARAFVESGYPRNDVLITGAGEPRDDSLIWLNTDRKALERMRAARDRRRRVGLYAPTFRRNVQTPVGRGGIDLQGLARCARENNLLLLLKLHPLLGGLEANADSEHLIEYDSRADVYPALAQTDFLVTDYSSIYFDYLLLDRPILFFPFDYETYVSQDRALLFDYETMTPGIKCHTQHDLETAMGKLCRDDDDGYAEARRNVREKLFSRHDGHAAQRMWSYLLEQHVGRAPPAA